MTIIVRILEGPKSGRSPKGYPELGDREETEAEL